MCRIGWVPGIAVMVGLTSCSGSGSQARDGATGGASGADGSTPTTLARVFAPNFGYPDLVPCDANGACPEEQTCFRLAAELAVCDSAERPVQTACSNSGVDKCGCGDLVCGAGTTCTAVPYDAHFQNDCLATPCASPEDCTGGSVCTPTSLILGGASTFRAVSRCLTPLCSSDAACTGGVGGRCALVMTESPPVAGTQHLDKIGCVFIGRAADATACAPSQATDLLEHNTPVVVERYYTCVGR